MTLRKLLPFHIGKGEYAPNRRIGGRDHRRGSGQPDHIGSTLYAGKERHARFFCGSGIAGAWTVPVRWSAP